MTKLLLIVTVLALFPPSARAQINESGLDKDPVFAAVAARQIYYPNILSRQALYGRVWVGFQVDNRGRIQGVRLVYPQMSSLKSKRYGIDYEVRRGLKHLPPLNPAYEGQYLLPVAFCFLHHGENPNPLIPTNQLPVGVDTGDRTLLPEVRIFAESPNSGIALSNFPPSRQIARP